jgi:hypothetical protein
MAMWGHAAGAAAGVLADSVRRLHTHSKPAGPGRVSQLRRNQCRAGNGPFGLVVPRRTLPRVLEAPPGARAHAPAQYAQWAGEPGRRITAQWKLLPAEPGAVGSAHAQAVLLRPVPDPARLHPIDRLLLSVAALRAPARRGLHRHSDRAFRGDLFEHEHGALPEFRLAALDDGGGGAHRARGPCAVRGLPARRGYRGLRHRG